MKNQQRVRSAISYLEYGLRLIEHDKLSKHGQRLIRTAITLLKGTSYGSRYRKQ